MKTNLGDIGNKAKRTELYRKQKGDKKAQQKERRRRREREAQELGEVSLMAPTLRCGSAFVSNFDFGLHRCEVWVLLRPQHSRYIHIVCLSAPLCVLP